MRRRTSWTLGVVATLVVVMTLPASAKLPPFEVEVTVIEGEAHVRVWFPSEGGVIQGIPVSQSFSSSEWHPPAEIDSLLAVYPAGDIDERGRPSTHENSTPVHLHRPVHLRWIESLGWYEGRVEVAGPGSWVVVQYPTADYDPDYGLYHPYPPTLTFEVPGQGGGLESTVLITALMTALIAGAGLALRRGRFETRTAAHPA